MLRNYREKPLTEEEIYAILDENSEAEFLSSDEDEIDVVDKSDQVFIQEEPEEVEVLNNDDDGFPLNNNDNDGFPGSILLSSCPNLLDQTTSWSSCPNLLDQTTSPPSIPGRMLRSFSTSPLNLLDLPPSAVCQIDINTSVDTSTSTVTNVPIPNIPKFVPTPKEKIEWKKNCSFVSQPISWFEPPNSNISELPEPVEYFQRYITPELIETMAQMTNIYTLKKNVKFAPTNAQEIKKFIGTSLIMGNFKYPRTRLYWDTKLGIDFVRKAMPFNRFMKLRQNLHVVDIDKDTSTKDRFWKVRPLYEGIRARCYQLPLPTNVCVDEQIIPFKGQINMKQYNPQKPNKWGLKNYVLCSTDGLMLDFILYQESTTEIHEEYKKFGSGASVVMQLCDRISTPNHLLIFDNYFSSYSLFEWLRDVKNIYAIGTVRLNRFANPPLLEEKKFKKETRGTSEEVISKDGIILTQWLDNKRVVLASTYIGIGKSDTCKRWDRKEKKEIEVPRPEVVKLYNQHMGGVDKLDFLVTLYRTFTRSRKWTLRMFTHALDLAVTNSWLEYKSDATVMGIPSRQQLDLIHFRYEVSEALIYASKTRSSKSKAKVGRPSKRTAGDANLDFEEELATPLFPISGIPVRRKEVALVRAVRMDELNHLPHFDQTSMNNVRCKNKNCKKKNLYVLR